MVFHRSILTWSDPLHVGLIWFIVPGFTGYLLLSAYAPSSSAHWTLAGLFGAFLLAASAPGVRRPDGKMELNNSRGEQAVVAVLLVAVPIATFLINMVVTGNIPLLSESGAHGRFSATKNSRLLYWLNNGLQGYGLILFALSRVRRVRKLALLSILLGYGLALLSASKGAIIKWVFDLVYFHFLCYLNGFRVHSKPQVQRILLGGLLLVMLVGPVAPAYLRATKSGSTLSELVMTVGVRLLGGFDQLVMVSFAEIPLESHASAHGLSMPVLYGMPLMKLLGGFDPPFNSMPEFLVHETFGVSDYQNRMLPNSNLILEGVLTGGKLFALIMLLSVGLATFALRRTLLGRDRLRFLDLIGFRLVVMAPLGIFIAGQDYFSLFLAQSFVYLALIAVFNLRRRRFVEQLKLRIV